MQDHKRSITSRVAWTAVLSVLVLALAGWLGMGSPVAADERATAATVGMTNDLRFDPETVRIQAGETVTWRNTSDVMHTVTADKDLASDPSHVQLPEGAEPFNSGNLQPGESFSRTFSVPGTYKYFCIPHESQGMLGTVIVERGR